MKQEVSVQELMSMLPSSLFEQIGQSNNVDYQVKKLTGERVFKLLLYGLLTGKELSFRILESHFENPVYQNLIGLKKPLKIDHSSLSERLSTIGTSYFKALFEYVSCVYSER